MEIEARKGLALLAYLAVTGQSHSRDALSTLLWPDSDQRRARSYLRHTLWTLKKALGETWLEVTREQVELNPEAEIWLDVSLFQERIAAVSAHKHPPEEHCPNCLTGLAAAVELYRGDFLSGFTLPDAPDFDEWQFFQTEELREKLAGALERLIEGYSGQGEYEVAIPHARRWLALDPLHEPAQRTLMQLYGEAGQKAAALRQCEEYAALLEKELGLPPEEETTTLYEAIKASRLLKPFLRVEDARQSAERVDRKDTSEWSHPLSTIAAPPAVRHNLPKPPTAFVGREQELTDLTRSLQDPACRLLTVVGPGGIGKTRLALEAAIRSVSTFVHGAYFVSLAPLSSAENIISALAEAINVGFFGDQEPKQQILNYLQRKHILLVMDNFEHLLDGAGLVVEILEAAPDVKVLVTSRERLNLSSETLYTLGGMSFGWSSSTPAEMQVETYDAVKLLLQRAQMIRPDVQPDAADYPHIARICRLVQGMPLALVLAVSWLDILTFQEIADEIAQSLDFLKTEMRDIPVRQRSVQAVFESSWKRLSPDEQQAFMKLTVFRGGFTRQAAQAVAGANLQTLRKLVNKSFVSHNQHERYDIHELLRQYGARQQETMGDVEQARDRHSNYYLDVLHRQHAELIGRNQLKILNEIEADLENIRSAWNWAVRQGKGEAIENALESIYQFYWTRSRFQEGLEAFSRAVQGLRRSATQTQFSFEATMAKLRTRQFKFYHALGRNEEAREGLQENLATIERMGDRKEIAFCFSVLGNVASGLGDFASAKQWYQDSLKTIEEVGDQIDMAYALYQLGSVGEELGEFVEAKRVLQQSLALYRTLEHQAGIAQALDKLGMVTFALGEYSESEGYYHESVMIFRNLGDQLGSALSLGGLGLVAWGMGGKLEEAKKHLEQSLAICRETGHQFQTAIRLALLAHVVNDLGAYRDAQQYCEEALAISKDIHYISTLSWALNGLGVAAYGQGDILTARTHLQAALKTAANSQVDTLMFLTYWATLLIKETSILSETPLSGKEARERAVEILTLVIDYPGNWQIFKDRAIRLLAELETELTPDMVTAARARAKNQTLNDIVAGILKETGNRGIVALSV